MSNIQDLARNLARAVVASVPVEGDRMHPLRDWNKLDEAIRILCGHWTGEDHREGVIMLAASGLSPAERLQYQRFIHFNDGALHEALHDASRRPEYPDEALAVCTKFERKIGRRVARRLCGRISDAAERAIPRSRAERVALRRRMIAATAEEQKRILVRRGFYSLAHPI